MFRTPRTTTLWFSRKHRFPQYCPQCAVICNHGEGCLPQQLMHEALVFEENGEKLLVLPHVEPRNFSLITVRPEHLAAQLMTDLELRAAEEAGGAAHGRCITPITTAMLAAGLAVTVDADKFGEAMRAQTVSFAAQAPGFSVFLGRHISHSIADFKRPCSLGCTDCSQTPAFDAASCWVQKLPKTDHAVEQMDDDAHEAAWASAWGALHTLCCTLSTPWPVAQADAVAATAAATAATGAMPASAAAAAAAAASTPFNDGPHAGSAPADGFASARRIEGLRGKLFLQINVGR
jgi:hypothetical protein